MVVEIESRAILFPFLFESDLVVSSSVETVGLVFYAVVVVQRSGVVALMGERFDLFVGSDWIVRVVVAFHIVVVDLLSERLGLLVGMGWIVLLDEKSWCIAVLLVYMVVGYCIVV